MWNFDKLVEYIDNGIEESIHLDYKAADALGKSEGKKKEISKDVSAFANSAGGVIIYGVKEFNDSSRSHLPEKIDPVNHDTLTKEWLEQVINSNIYPKIDGILIHPIRINEAGSQSSVYIVEIPQSKTVHQAKDKRYYKRYNFESVAMEDYEVKDIINRSNKTNIRIFFKPDIERQWYDRFIQKPEQFRISAKMWAHNSGNRVAQFVQVFVSGNAEASEYIIEPHTRNGQPFQLIFSNEEERTITVNGENHVIGTYRTPVLPNTSILIGELRFYSDIIQNQMGLDLLISTEDGSRSLKLEGRDIMERYSD